MRMRITGLDERSLLTAAREGRDPLGILAGTRDPWLDQGATVLNRAQDALEGDPAAVARILDLLRLGLAGPDDGLADVDLPFCRLLAHHGVHPAGYAALDLVQDRARPFQVHPADGVRFGRSDAHRLETPTAAWTAARDGTGRVRIAATPATLATGVAPGTPLAALLSHPAIDDLPLEIAAVETDGATTRISWRHGLPRPDADALAAFDVGPADRTAGRRRPT